MPIYDTKAVITRFIEEVVDQGKVDVIEELVASAFVNHNPLPGVPADSEGLPQKTRERRHRYASAAS
jgi:hypothetical protein